MRSRRAQLLAAAGVLIAVLIAVALWPRAHQSPTGTGSDAGGATCALADLPPEAADTVRSPDQTINDRCGRPDGPPA